MWKLAVFSILCIVLIEVHSSNAAGDKKVVCYLGSWAYYRQNDGKFEIESIEPKLCTHLIYGFAKLQNNAITPYDPYLDLVEEWGKGYYKKFNDLKANNPHLKTLIAIGGWNEGSEKYSIMAKDPNTRKTFVNSVLDFLPKYGFDGLDLDWEYPGMRGGAPEDKQNFAILCQELHDALQPKGYLLTAAVGAGQATIDVAYDIPAMDKYLDFINVMAYDFHGSWERVTGHNAPMAGKESEGANGKILNVKYATDYWLKGGLRASKLILGMGLYGRSFTLQDPSKTDIGAPTTGPGQAGPITREGGMLGYNEICLFIKEGGWKVVHDNDIESPYMSKGNQWAGYDSVDSIAIKTQYVLSKNLGGAMVWSIETDDFRGKCHGHKFPLLFEINRVLNGGEFTPPPIVPTEKPDPDHTKPTEATHPPPTNPPDTEFPCHDEGLYANPHDCSKFYQCVKYEGGWHVIHFTCPAGTLFDSNIRACNFEKDVIC